MAPTLKYTKKCPVRSLLLKNKVKKEQNKKTYKKRFASHPFPHTIQLYSSEATNIIKF